jgi:hypothetical protein
MKSLLLIIVPAVLLIWLTPLSAEAKTFKTDSYSVNMPNSCNTEDKQNRFSDDAFFKCKNMGNAVGDIAFEMAGAPYTGTDAELPDELMTVISDKWSDPQEVERGTDKYVINNQTAPHVIATFEQEFTGLFGLPTKSEDWVYMVVGIKTGDDMLYAQYKNDQSHFDEDLDIFEKVLKSIKIERNTNTNTTTEDDGPTFTTQGNDLPKTKALCDTVTTQSGKELCGTLLN